MNVKQRDIVLLPVPFSDQSQTKVRPAVVVSNDRINSRSDDIVLVPLTSVLKEESYSLIITQDDLSQGKLIVPSRARADKLFTAEKSLIKMKIGTLKADVFMRVRSEIVRVVG